MIGMVLAMFASTVFAGAIGVPDADASHQISTTNDQDGPDDVPAQTDISSLGFDDSHLLTDSYYIAQIQFDDTAYPGGNSGDGCIFFTNNDCVDLHCHPKIKKKIWI